MDTQREKKVGAIGLGTLAALLGATAGGAHNLVKLNRPGAKLIRNVAGGSALGVGLGSAILATKYLKNKKKGIIK